MKVVSTLHDLTQKVGANSKSFPTLPAFKQASGSRLYAQSGNVFLDLAFTTCANLLGHNISSIQQAIVTAPNHLPPLDNSVEHAEIQSVYNSINKNFTNKFFVFLSCRYYRNFSHPCFPFRITSLRYKPHIFSTDIF